MYRKCLNFYINKNGDLSCIWYAKRKYKMLGQYRDERADVDLTDPPYAVRAVTLWYNCDKSEIRRISYEQSAVDAQTRIIRFMDRAVRITYDTITDEHLKTLRYRCPRKYTKWFFKWLKYEVTEEQFDKIQTKFWKV